MSALAQASGQTPTAPISCETCCPQKVSDVQPLGSRAPHCHCVEQQGLTAIKSKFDFEMCREEGGVGVHKQGAQAAGGADP